MSFSLIPVTLQGDAAKSVPIKGDNELVLKVVGKNEKSTGYEAGINYLVLMP